MLQIQKVRPSTIRLLTKNHPALQDVLGQALDQLRTGAPVDQERLDELYMAKARYLLKASFGNDESAKKLDQPLDDLLLNLTRLLNGLGCTQEQVRNAIDMVEEILGELARAA